MSAVPPWVVGRPVWLAVLLLAAQAAQAHKVLTSVWVEGDSIAGEIGFSSGALAPEGTRVEVLGPGGERLGEAFTDAEGLFRYRPHSPIDHRFKADLGAGHIVEMVLQRAELPLDLRREVDDELGASRASAPRAAAVPAPVPAPSTAELQAMIAKTVQREIRPLRQELAAYKEKNDLQAVLGGIGYICGVFGLAFFILCKRRHRAR